MAKYKLKPEVKCFPFGPQCGQVVNSPKKNENGEPIDNEVELTDALAEFLISSGRLSAEDFEITEEPAKPKGK